MLVTGGWGARRAFFFARVTSWSASAPMVVEAHVRVLLAPSSSPWIAIAVYFVPAPCGSSRITAVRSSMPAVFCGTPAAFWAVAGLERGGADRRTGNL